MTAVKSVAWAPGLPRAVLWVLWAACIYGVLEVIVTAGMWLVTQQQHHQTPCRPDDEGLWSIGIFKGASPFSLKPVEQWRPQAVGAHAWPVANPIYTCAHVTDVPASFVADPFLHVPRQAGGAWHLFYESKSLHNMQGDIGAAVSTDHGLSWKHSGIVLDEQWHLSYPFVFEDQGKKYMLPEGSKSGQLRLYTTSEAKFPGGWHLHQVLVEEPLVDASLIPPELLAGGIAGSDGRWYLLASNARRKSSKRCREMEVWHADTLAGPWRLHPGSPVRQGVQGSRSAGRPFVWAGKLYRLGQDCTTMYGHRMRVFQVQILNATHYQDEETALGFDPRSGRHGEATWNSMRYHHMDAHALATGEWVAVMDGDRYVSDYLTHRWLGRLKVLLPTAALIACLSALAVHWGWTRAARPALHIKAHGKAAAETAAVPGRGGAIGSLGSWLPAWSPGAGPQPAPHHGQSRGLGRTLLVCLVVGVPLWLLWAYGRLLLLSFVLWYVKEWGGSPLPLAIAGQVSKLTVIVMSYSARTLSLKAFVQHYSQCSSVGDIVVVWNKGPPPDPLRDFDSQVPVRIRVETANSMNNRFQPDPLITNRGILMLDDDLLLPCADIERGFARWRQHPERVVGFFPRLLEGDVPQYQCTQCEGHSYQQGLYNLILAGASFLDKDRWFPAYSSPGNQAGRDYVDKVHNCDDLLLNYLAAAHLKDAQHADWVRPTKRIDVGKLTSARLSGGGQFGNVRHNCTRDFAEMFGNPLKGKAYPLNFEGRTKPMCPPVLGCMFV